MRVILKGISRYGKTRVSRLGTQWEFLHFQNNVSCLNGARGMYIRPVSDPTQPRWIKAENDPDFRIEGWIT